jgi:hypothetical protein
MQLFHVSVNKYTPGKVVGNYKSTDFYESRKSNLSFFELENAFDARRPSGCYSRLSSVYAFDSIEACKRYWDAERNFGAKSENYASTEYYYRVSMNNFTKAPIFLVNHALKLKDQSISINSVIDEYWSPKSTWRCWEYLSYEFTVEEILPQPDNIIESTALALTQSQEVKLMQKLFPTYII